MNFFYNNKLLSNLNINILVNNAAIIHEKINLIDFNMEEWENVIKVNLVNAVKLTRLIFQKDFISQISFVLVSLKLTIIKKIK